MKITLLLDRNGRLVCAICKRGFDCQVRSNPTILHRHPTTQANVSYRVPAPARYFLDSFHTSGFGKEFVRVDLTRPDILRKAQDISYV